MVYSNITRLICLLKEGLQTQSEYLKSGLRQIPSMFNEKDTFSKDGFSGILKNKKGSMRSDFQPGSFCNSKEKSNIHFQSPYESLSSAQLSKQENLENAEFEYKVHEYYFFIRTLQYFTFLIFLHRQLMQDDSQNYIIYRYISPILGLICLTCCRIFRAKSLKTFNWSALITGNIIQLLGMESSLNIIFQNQVYINYEHSSSIILIQVYLSFVTSVDWRMKVLNHILIWFYYFTRIGLIIGFSQIPTQVYLSVALQIALFTKVLQFKQSLSYILKAYHNKVSQIPGKIEKTKVPTLMYQFLLQLDKDNLQAKLPEPSKMYLDFQSILINKETQKLIVMQDNTEAIQREKSLLQNQLQTVFFASVAHDLRQPLNSISASNQILIDNVNLNQNMHKIALQQQSSIDFLMNLVEDIMDFSTLQFNTFNLNFSWFFPQEIVSEVFQISEFQAQMKGVQLIFDNKIEENVQIYADKRRLKQVLLNLTTNALKFTSQGYVKVTMKIEAEDQEDLDWGKFEDFNDDIFDEDLSNMASKHSFIFQDVLPMAQKALKVYVEDTGIGISEGDLNKLFKVFGKLKASAHLNQQGIGLGLTICKKICEFMGGSISAESSANQGTIFSFNVNLDYVRKQIHLQKPVNENINNESIDKINLSIFNQLERYKSDSQKQSPFTIRDLDNFIPQDTSLMQLEDISKIFEKRKHQQLSSGILGSFQNLRKIKELNKILIVDDSSFNVMALKLLMDQLFSKLNMKMPAVDIANDGEQGFQMLQQNISSPYNLVFVDQLMPRLNGFELMIKVKNDMLLGQLRQYKKTVFILSTANKIRDNSYKEAGFADYLEKPINIQKLEKILLKQIQRLCL
eukprot:403340624